MRSILILFFSLFLCTTSYAQKRKTTKRPMSKTVATVVKDVKDMTVEELNKSAMAGNMKAQVRLARLLFEGEEVEQEYDGAHFWLRDAVKAQDPEALYLMAQAYIEGYGVDKEPVKGIEYLLQSAEKEFPDALFLMGKYHDRGWSECGIEYSLEKAFEYYSKCPETNPNVLNRLAQFYKNGEGGQTKDMEKAAEYWKKSSLLNDPVGLCQYGECLMYGRGVEQNVEEGRAYIVKAAKLGSVRALVNLEFK